MRFRVYKVIHSHHIYTRSIVWTQGAIARGDPDPGLLSAELDAQERKAIIGGGGEKCAERVVIRVEILDGSGSREVHIAKDSAESGHCRVDSTVGARYEKRPSVMLLPTGVNRRSALKVVKMVP